MPLCDSCLSECEENSVMNSPPIYPNELECNQGDVARSNFTCPLCIPPFSGSTKEISSHYRVSTRPKFMLTPRYRAYRRYNASMERRRRSGRRRGYKVLASEPCNGDQDGDRYEATYSQFDLARPHQLLVVPRRYAIFL